MRIDQDRFPRTWRALNGAVDDLFAVLFLSVLAACLIASWFFPLVDHIALGLILLLILSAIGSWVYGMSSHVRKGYREDREAEKEKVVREVMES